MQYQRNIIEAVRKQKANPTPAELLMIQKLIFRNIRFSFVYPVVLESRFFTADFFIPKYGLLIEIDGGYHSRPDQKMRDTMKDVVYEALGYNILRIKNEEVDTFDTRKIKSYAKNKITKNKQRTR